MDRYIDYQYAHTIEAKAFAVDYVKALKEEGCKLYVLTASPYRLAEVCLKRYGIFEMFEHIWDAADTPYGKTDQRTHEEILKQIGCTAREVVYYDDDQGYLKTAKSMGYMAVGVFDEDSAEIKESIRQAVDLYIDSFEEIL